MTVAIVSFLAAFAASGCIVTGAHCAAWVHAAEHRLTVFFMGATGGHADPRETGPLNVLPVEPEEPRTSLLAPEWTAAPYAGHHAAREPRETPALAPGLSGIDVYQRFVRMCADNGIEHPEFGPLRPTPPEGIEVTRRDGTMLVGGMSVFDPCPTPEQPSMSMLPLTGPIPRVHSREYNEAPQLAVREAQERLARGLIA
jgi:hypothetical protein